MVLVAMAVAAALLAGCGGGGGGGGSTPAAIPPTYTASGTASAPNVVTITGSAISDDTIELQVKIGGPTTSTNLYSFAFDLLLSNPSLVQVIGVSAGDALTGTPTAQAALSGTRIAVGITRTDHVGNGVTGTSATLVKIRLRTLTKGSTTVKFVGAPPSTSAADADAQALDPNGATTGIHFDTASGTITQN